MYGMRRDVWEMIIQGVVRLHYLLLQSLIIRLLGSSGALGFVVALRALLCSQPGTDWIGSRARKQMAYVMYSVDQLLPLEPVALDRSPGLKKTSTIL